MTRDPLFQVTVHYQTEAGDASSATVDVRASNEDSAIATAQARIAHDRRRKVGVVIGGDVEPVNRCSCGITVFRSSDNTTGLCTGCERKASRASA